MVLTNLQGTAYTPSADLPNGPIRWSIRWSDAISNSCHSAAAEFIFETTVLSPVRTTSDIAPTIVRRQVDNAVRYVVYLLNQDAPAVKMMILKTSGPCQWDLKRRIWEPRRRRCPQQLAHRTITAAPPPLKLPVESAKETQTFGRRLDTIIETHETFRPSRQ